MQKVIVTTSMHSCKY